MGDELQELGDKLLLKAQQRIIRLKKEIKGIEHMLDDLELGTRIQLQVDDCRTMIAEEEYFIHKNISLSDLKSIINIAE